MRHHRPRAGRGPAGSSAGSWSGCSAYLPGSGPIFSSLPRSLPGQAETLKTAARSAAMMSPDHDNKNNQNRTRTGAQTPNVLTVMGSSYSEDAGDVLPGCVDHIGSQNRTNGQILIPEKVRCKR